jgi:general nucleoside transport system permease protein
MSTVTETHATASPSPSPSTEREVILTWKATIAFAAFTVLAAALFLLLRRPSDVSTFRLASETDFFALPDVVLATFASGIVVVIFLAGLTVFSLIRRLSSRQTPLWVAIVFALFFLIGFLAWASAGETVPIPGLLIGTVTLSVPLVFGAMSGVLSERVGVVNIAIEGQLLAGAFSSAVVASVTGNPYLGLLAAAVAGILVSLALATFALIYLVEQVIVGVVINVLVVGLTNFFYGQVLSNDTALLNNPPRFERLPIPGLSQIPIIGPTLFNQTIIVYAMYVVVAVVAYALFHTKWGLRLRAVGEHPTAADTVGIKVNRTRFFNVSLAGAIAGFGGSFFTLGLVGAFNREMTAGLGYIALAAVIFGRWDPIRATLAALLFGFTTNLQNVLAIIGSPVPSEFMLMLPYVVTIFAVAGLVGTVRGPAASGKPYIKS